RCDRCLACRLPKKIVVTLFRKDIDSLASVLVDVLKSLASVWKLLPRHWRRNADRRAELPRLLYIVSRRNPATLRGFRRLLADAPNHQVFPDRREGDD